MKIVKPFLYLISVLILIFGAFSIVKYCNKDDIGIVNDFNKKKFQIKNNKKTDINKKRNHDTPHFISICEISSLDKENTSFLSVEIQSKLSPALQPETPLIATELQKMYKSQNSLKESVNQEEIYEEKTKLSQKNENLGEVATDKKIGRILSLNNSEDSKILDMLHKDAVFANTRTSDLHSLDSRRLFESTDKTKISVNPNPNSHYHLPKTCEAKNDNSNASETYLAEKKNVQFIIDLEARLSAIKEKKRVE